VMSVGNTTSRLCVNGRSNAGIRLEGRLSGSIPNLEKFDLGVLGAWRLVERGGK
jgi:hypothetical protein